MKRTNCQKLLNIETISSAFKNNRQDISEHIITCFYSCYRLLFVKWATITYRHYPVDLIEALANDSFTDGVLKLKESAGRGELYQSNASVKTVLFKYCRYQLLSHLKEEERLAEKNKKLALHFPNETGYHTGETETEMKEKDYQNLMQALAKIPATDRQIIQWRHIEEKSNDEIAALLAIKVDSATSRIYRCMERLRNLMEEMEKG
ncbi:MAG: sigma-70 family RNA polymerase sigma factor [Chitinophagaceae bacterium]|nr:sigma-70 family RNA polymerase sigma factor [Chitinophagaceae bacterium]